MKKISVLGVVIVTMTLGHTVWADWSGVLNDYSCIEVEKFAVDRQDFSSQEKERAATIPDQKLTNLQHKIVGEIARKKIIGQVTKSNEQPCQGKALTFGGKVTDYKEGNRAARMLIGLGAGKQKFEVESYLKDKQTGRALAQKTIIDRKVGGLAGGDEAKGESDFAEKVAEFVATGK